MSSKEATSQVNGEMYPGSRRRSSVTAANPLPSGQVGMQDDAYRKLSVSIENFEDSARDAKQAIEREQQMTLLRAVRLYPGAIMYSMLISFALVMEGYDTALIWGFFALPQFRERFGRELPDGTYQVTSAWQSGLANGAQIGQISGLMITGLIADRYGYRKTLLGALIFMVGVVFLFFFAQNIGMLFAAEILAGLPWGAFQTLTTTYAADITPIQLRHILTSYVNMCWVIGQLLSSGILRGFVGGTTDWAWRIPYSLQWIFPLPVIIAVIFAPESPWWLVRHGHFDQARKSLRKLSSKLISDVDIDQTLTMISHTNELEKAAEAGTSYIDCFKGTNRRRTEIAVMVWVAQVFCGIWFGGSVTYFMQQAGLSNNQAFDMGIGNNCLALAATMCAWFVMSKVGRRTLYLTGLSVCFVLLITVGFMGIPALDGNDSLGWASGAMLMLFVITFDLTVGPVCYTLVAEIPSTRLRVKTAILARNAYNVASIGANFLNPPILNPASWNLRGKGGFVWCGFCLISLIWSYFRLPEPKGLSPAELDVLFENRISARKFRNVTADPFRSDTLEVATATEIHSDGEKLSA